MSTPESPLLSLQAVAERLGLPLELLRRRVEAGDVPAQRLDYGDRVEYLLRLSDLGIEEPESPVAVAEAEPEISVEEQIAAVWQTPAVEPPPVAPSSGLELVGRTAVYDDQPCYDDPAPVAESDLDEPDITDLELSEPAEAVPPPAHTDELTLFEYSRNSPRGDVAAMMLDPRELVGGLLDRWERTLEQRIYAEQRQRFQGELVARQNLVKQLQMELKASRAEHAAMQAEKERLLAQTERALADAQRELEEIRPVVAPPAQSKRRHWFFGR